MSVSPKIKVSIGIPVYNEEKNIDCLLRRITSLGEDYEIIVVSSGSTDCTNEIVRNYDNVTLIVEDVRQGKVSAIKKIIENAKGDVIVLSDGDVLLDKSSVTNITKCFDDPQVLACTGRVEPIHGKSNMMNKISSIACSIWDEFRRDNDHSGNFLYPTGYLHAIRKDTLESVIIENRIINDDAAIAVILFRQGVSYRYCRDAVVKVRFPDNISDYFKQKVRTRLGRRQRGYREMLTNQEKQLTRRLRSVIIKGSSSDSLHATILYMFDFAARLTATCKERFISDASNLWEQINSTK